MVVTDALKPGQPIVFVNAAFTAMTGYSAEEVIGRNCRFLQGPGTDPAAIQILRDAIAGNTSARCQLLNYRKDGSAFWNDLALDPMRNKAGVVESFVGMQHDASGQDAARAHHGDADSQLSSIAGDLPGYLYRQVLRPGEDIACTYVSPSLSVILGLECGADLGGDRLFEHFHADDLGPFLEQGAESGRSLAPFRAEFRLQSACGAVHWFRTAANPARAENGDVVWNGVAMEITAERTGPRPMFVPEDGMMAGPSSRSSFHAALARIVSAVAVDDTRTGVFRVDLDTFQSINDAFGIGFGDKFLRRIGLRLMEFAQARGGTASRLGGDDFAVLLPGLAPSCTGEELAEAICLEVRRPLVINGEQASAEACVGAVLFGGVPETSPTAAAEDWSAELMSRASLALQAAKREGPGLCRVYSPELDDRVRHLPAMRRALHRAVARHEFELHYQPIVDLASGSIVAAEALLRWRHPELGLQRPGLFIPIAEASGLIVPIGEWVVRSAFMQGQDWARKGLRPIRIAINLSGVQLQRPGLLDMITRALADTGADPRCFEFELTEGTLLDASDDIRGQLDAIRALGFTLALDDFGTGHSTFKYLRDHPIDKLKIDQTFVRDLVDDSNDATIVRSMLALAASLNLAVVAEGVETAAQRDFLLRAGCAIGQGFLFSRPLAADDLGRLLCQRCAG